MGVTAFTVVVHLAFGMIWRHDVPDHVPTPFNRWRILDWIMIFIGSAEVEQVTTVEHGHIRL